MPVSSSSKECDYFRNRKFDPRFEWVELKIKNEKNQPVKQILRKVLCPNPTLAHVILDCWNSLYSHFSILQCPNPSKIEINERVLWGVCVCVCDWSPLLFWEASLSKEVVLQFFGFQKYSPPNWEAARDVPGFFLVVKNPPTNAGGKRDALSTVTVT